jgi:hypothetical protein
VIVADFDRPGFVGRIVVAMVAVLVLAACVDGDPVLVSDISPADLASVDDVAELLHCREVVEVFGHVRSGTVDSAVTAANALLPDMPVVDAGDSARSGSL